MYVALVSDANLNHDRDSDRDHSLASERRDGLIPVHSRATTEPDSEGAVSGRDRTSRYLAEIELSGDRLRRPLRGNDCHGLCQRQPEDRKLELSCQWL